MDRRWIVRPSAESDIALAAQDRCCALQFPAVTEDVRRALLQTFLYAVYFRVTGEAIVILAVLHLRRDHRAWLARRSS